MASGPKILILLALGVAACIGISLRAGQREATADARTPPAGSFATVDGVRLHVVVAGSGPDLVLIHGASGNWRDLTFALLPALQDHYRVIMIDRPGLGYSDRATGQSTGPFVTTGESPETQARLLQKVAASLGADRPIVMGHSFGGAVALAWAAYLPDHIAALVDISGATMPFPGELDIQYRLMNTKVGAAVLPPLISALVPESYVQDAVAGVFAPDAMPQAYPDYFDPMFTLSRARFRANAQQVNALRENLVVQSVLYPSIAAPTEIVHGTADTIVPIDIHSRPLSQIIPGAHLVELPGAGHMPHQTHTAEVVAAIDRAAVRAGLH